VKHSKVWLLVMFCWSSWASGCFEDTKPAHPCANCLECEECVEGESGSECAPIANDYQQCGVDGHVHWFDACGGEQSVALECLGCQTCVNTGAETAECQATDDQAYTQCGSDGAIHWIDSCDEEGAVAEICDDCETCYDISESEAACEPSELHAYQQCGADGNIHWFDSCDGEGLPADDCSTCGTCVDTSDTSAECVADDLEVYQQCGSGDDVHWIDSCDAEAAVAIDCDAECETCVDTSDTTAECQVTVLEDHLGCGSDENIHWFDSCGTEGELAWQCSGGCVDDACVFLDCDPGFTARSAGEVYSGAKSLTAADIDGDSHLDILGINLFWDELTWWENASSDGDGSYWVDHLVNEFGNEDYAIAADLDGDDDLDIVTTSVGWDYIAWWENVAGDGSTWTEATVAGDVDGASDVFAADVDGDDDLDLVGVASVSDAVAWWENTEGDGDVWTQHDVSLSFNYGVEVHAADVDGDFDADIVAASQYGHTISWWGNASPSGDGTEWTVCTVDSAFSSASSVYVADVDNDDDLDILGAAFAGDEVAWWENSSPTGDGTVWTEHTVSSVFDGAISVVAADVDGDGDVDVLGAAWYAGEITWWENASPSGDGSVWNEYVIDATLVEPSDVFAADIDGDGDIDVVGSSHGAEQVTWYENDCIP
jgi:hypothetical protein